MYPYLEGNSKVKFISFPHFSIILMHLIHFLVYDYLKKLVHSNSCLQCKKLINMYTRTFIYAQLSDCRKNRGMSYYKIITQSAQS